MENLKIALEKFDEDLIEDEILKNFDFTFNEIILKEDEKN